MKIEELKQDISEKNSYQLCMKDLIVTESNLMMTSISKNTFFQTPTKKVLLPTKKIVRLF